MGEENKNEINENKEVKDVIAETEVSVENTNIQIADDVIAVIAGVAVAEVPGVAAMSGGFAGGISEVLSGKKNLSKGIKVEAGEKETKIDVNIIVEFGVRIPDVAFEIQNRVKKAVENMTGLKVVEVNVHVQGVNADTTLEKDNNDLREKIGELEERIKQNLHEEKKLEEKNEKIKEELKEVYNSKRWKYTEKLSNFFHKKLK